ncbi:MAG: hypothetical protein R3C59_24035 [Planctomycetaceae bacterium]
MNWLADRCGFQTLEDWYAVRKHHFKQNRGGGLLCTQYQDSVLAALTDYAPDFEWQPWRFQVSPRAYWDNPANRRRYMDWLAGQLGFQKPEDWYSVTKQTFIDHCGSGLLNICFGDSVQAALLDYLPDYPWKPWLFPNTPNRYWHQPENRRAYMTWLGEQLGYQCPEDWYRVTKEQFYQNAGSGFLRCHYNDSPQLAVREFFPDLAWTPWLFVSVPQQYWKDVENRLCYLRWLGQQLGFQTTDDWYRLSNSDFNRHHGAGLLGFYSEGSVGNALREALRAGRTSQRVAIWPLIQLIECSVSGRSPQSLLTVPV